MQRNDSNSTKRRFWKLKNISFTLISYTRSVILRRTNAKSFYSSIVFTLFLLKQRKSKISKMDSPIS